VTRAEEFEQLRALLFAIAYRILGSVSEAEDAGPGDLAEERPAVRLERRDPLGGDQSVGGVVLTGREEVGVPELSVSHGRRGYLPCCHRSASAGVSMPRPVDEEET
jgi:hypothetical protein